MTQYGYPFNNGGYTLKLHAQLSKFPISMRAVTLKDRQDKLKQRYRKGNRIIFVKINNDKQWKR